MKKRNLVYGLALGMTLAFAVSAGAATFTTDDGVISIETPDPEDENTAEWKQMVDPNYWFVISDGKCSITIDHLSNGENLPAVQIADDNCEGVFQTFVSTKDEVFVVKGLDPDGENLGTLLEIAGTIKVQKYGTKTAIKKENAPEVSEFGIRTINAAYYVNTDELNVRSSYSTDSSILGVLKRGEEVYVKGAVQRNGADYGWYQITYNGSDAYVSAGFLTDKKASAESSSKDTAKSTEKYAVSNGFTAYDSEGRNQGQLVKYSDGYYYSNDMQPYRDNGDGSYYGINTGDTLYSYNPYPEEPAQPGTQQGSFQVWDENGNVQGFLMPRANDSYYYSNDDMPYRDNGDGSYYGVNTGDTLYSYDPTYNQSSKSNETGTAGSGYYDNDSNSVATHVLSEETTGAEVYVTADSYDSYVWTDGSGTEYQNNGDGTFTDYYGNDYNVVA